MVSFSSQTRIAPNERRCALNIEVFLYTLSFNAPQMKAAQVRIWRMTTPQSHAYCSVTKTLSQQRRELFAV